MDYHFWFWIGIAFFAGRFSKWKFYVGDDKAKYEAADIGILIR